MPSPRLPRFKRFESMRTMDLTDRDRVIIRLVAENRFLRSSHVTSLVAGSSQNLLRRLQLLYHHGYLERPRAQIDRFHNGGSNPMVYGLGSKAAHVLRDHKLHDISKPRRIGDQNRSVGRIFLDHALLVSDIMVLLELACRESRRAELFTESSLRAQSGLFPQYRGVSWRVNVGSRFSLGVVPDRTFALSYTLPNRLRDTAYFFLEADRGTMPVKRENLIQTSFYRKLLAYEATWAQQIHRRQFGFHRFRVVTVTTNPARLASLVKACSKLPRGHGLFLFAHIGAFEKPTDPFAPIWQTGRPGELSSLLS